MSFNRYVIGCPVVLTILVLMCLWTSCSSGAGAVARTIGEAAGVVEPAARTAVVLSVVIDASPGSVQRADVDVTLGVLLAWFVRQSPGSEMRVFGVADDLAHAARPVLVLVLPRPSMVGDRARRVMQQRFVQEATPKVSSAVDRIFGHVPRHSAIAETITVVGIARASIGNRRIIVVLSDALQENNLGNFECAQRLPNSKAWEQRLRAAGLLLPDQLKDERVIFAFTGPKPIDHNRCTTTMRHYLDVQDLWQYVLTNSGAQVEFSSFGITAELLTGG